MSSSIEKKGTDDARAVCACLWLSCARERAVRDAKRFLGFPVEGRLFFVWIYFARVRYRKVTISARVQIRFGLNVVPLVPMVISLPTAQSTASA